MTTLTLAAPGCDGCEFELTQGRWDSDSPSGTRVWHSKKRVVEDGAVTFKVPTARTRGLSATFTAPWEGQLPGKSTVVFAYKGFPAGSATTLADARKQRRGSACWAGTSSREVTIPITVAKVKTDGVHHRVRGSLAFTSRAEERLAPLREVYSGVMISNDDNICGPKR